MADNLYRDTGGPDGADAAGAIQLAQAAAPGVAAAGHTRVAVDAPPQGVAAAGRTRVAVDAPPQGTSVLATIVMLSLCVAIVATSLALGQVLVAQYAHPLAWKQAVEPILTWPLWAVAGAPVLLLLAVTLKRKPRAKAAIYRFSPDISAGELLAWRALSPRAREMAARSSRR